MPQLRGNEPILGLNILVVVLYSRDKEVELMLFETITKMKLTRTLAKKTLH
jgi:hypothetical protein